VREQLRKVPNLGHFTVVGTVGGTVDSLIGKTAGFHIGQIAVFGWGFHANMVMLGWFFLPIDRLIDRWA
jgi:hypothetical protein